MVELVLLSVASILISTIRGHSHDDNAHRIAAAIYSLWIATVFVAGSAWYTGHLADFAYWWKRTGFVLTAGLLLRSVYQNLSEQRGRHDDRTTPGSTATDQGEGDKWRGPFQEGLRRSEFRSRRQALTRALFVALLFVLLVLGPGTWWLRVIYCGIAWFLYSAVASSSDRLSRRL